MNDEAEELGTQDDSTSARQDRRVRIVAGGPIMVEGPVQVELPDGTVASSDRVVVALCGCRRSSIYPFCDTSHRRRCRRNRQ
ncbi:CDGSH iron-sulfur domain-containing protein [Nocardia sp. NPDC051570]|uniref:CDGSH iron-sulfur domain-containing protein n=1 Tax=Nocardia sp. NPDC051570 TaxID=3364324 RepID=UPI0037B4C935